MKTFAILAFCLVLGLLALFIAKGASGPRGGSEPSGGSSIDLGTRGTRDPTGSESDAGSTVSAPTEPTQASRSESDRRAANPIEPRAAATPGRFLLLDGVVLGEAGPVPSARVIVSSRGKLVADADTNRAGAFDLSIPVPARDVVLRIVARGYASYARDLGERQIGANQSLGNIFLRRGTVLAGTVVDPLGHPIAGAEVTLSTLAVPARRGIGETARSGVNGRFEFPAAPAGRVNLTAYAKGFAERTLEHRHIAGSEALIQLSEGVDLSVLILDESGEPIEGADVTARATTASTQQRMAQSDSDGRATFLGLSEAQWNVRAIAPGFKPGALAAVHAGGRETELRLVAWPCATGIIVQPGGDPAPPGTRVHAVPNAARGGMIRRLPGGAIADDEGRFRACDLRPGQYRILVFAPGFATSESTPFRVTDRGDVDVGRLQLLTGGDLVLELRSPSGPASGVRFELLTSEPLPAQIWSDARLGTTELPPSDSDGKVRISNLSAGLVWIIARDDKLVPKALGPFSIVEGQSSEPAPIVLQAGGRISGHTRTQSGTAVPHARLSIRGTVVVPYIQSDGNGAYVSPPLPAGIYSVEATSVIGGELARADPVDVRLSAGEARTANIVLRTP